MNCSRILLPLILVSILSTSSGAELDREKIEMEVMSVLDEFMRSFSALDAHAHTATYHFPHFRLAQGVMRSWDTREEATQVHVSGFGNLPSTGWSRSVWIDRKIISVSASKVHVATRFQRQREDGSEIVTTESLYILTHKDGRWGVKMRSSYL